MGQPKVRTVNFLSNRVSEVFRAFNDPLTLIRLPIRSKELSAQAKDTDDDQAIAPTSTTHQHPSVRYPSKTTE